MSHLIFTIYSIEIITASLEKEDAFLDLSSQKIKPILLGEGAWDDPFTDWHEEIQLSEMSGRNPIRRE